MRRILRPFLFLAALLFLFEAWVWERLSPIVGWFVRLIFWRRLREVVTAAIENLPPYPTLLVFAVPIICLLPFKLAAFWLLAHGHFILGGGIFLLAKIVGVAIAAFLFETCKPKLLQIDWFVVIYKACLRAKDWAHRLVDPYKRRIKVFARYLRRQLPRSARPSFARRALSRMRYRAWNARP
jgi:hypothetical protein